MNNNLMEQEERKRASFLERLQIFTDVRNSYQDIGKTYSAYKSRLKKSYRDYLQFVVESQVHDLLTVEINYMYEDYFDRKPDEGKALDELLDFFGDQYKGLNRNERLQKKVNEKALAEFEKYMGSSEFTFVEE